MSASEKISLIQGVAKDLCVDDLTYLVNSINKLKRKRKEEESACGSTGKRNSSVRPPPTPLKLGRVPSTSAWKVPLIFNGDLVPEKGLLFLDVEKISLKKGQLPTEKGKYGHREVGVNVAVVDQKGLLVMWAFIYRDPTTVCQYFTKLNRLTEVKVSGGVSLETVREIMDIMFQSNKIVGKNVVSDLSSLSFDEEFKERNPYRLKNILDLESFYVDKNNQPYKLKLLAEELLSEEERNVCFQEGSHSAITDARITMKLFLKMCEMKQNDAEFMKKPFFDFKRPPKEKFVNTPGDYCKCSNTKK